MVKVIKVIKFSNGTSETTLYYKTGLTPLMNSMQYGLAYSLTNLQIFIKESYGYDKNGNRASKTTNYGTIEYNYDRENRLLSSGSKGQTYVNYSYDSMGNLLTEESSMKSTKYAYNSQNRLIYCEVTDKSKKEYSQTNYAYDAFGRRVIVQDKGEAALRTLYDGLTFDVIKQSPTFENGLFTDSQNTGIRWSNNGKPTGDRYRYIGDEERQDNNRYIYLDENSYKTTGSRYQGERTQINVNGTLAAQSTTEGTQYFTTDLFGSVTTVSDNYGYQLDSYTYDAFGSLVQGRLSGSTDYGYLGKQSDSTSKLYNYGYRDYKPQSARFTTVDPIRDGTNWFAYVNNDPVNFVDLWGLEATDGKINWVKEIFDCLDEVKFGLEEKAAIKIPDIITLEISLDIVSADLINNKGDFADSGITSGFKASVSLGNENMPIIQQSIEVSKTVPTGGTAFDLLQMDYEVKTEFEFNTDAKVSIPVPIPGLVVTINTSEIEDLGQKIINKIDSYFR